MTIEQEKAIEILEHIKKEFKGNAKAPNINSRNTATIKIQAIETVLNMLKEKDREIEKKDKIIDLMVKEINETVRGYIDYCQFKMVCDRNCKKCIKQYFERKVEE